MTSTTNDFTTSNPIINALNMEGSKSTSIMNISSEVPKIFRHLRQQRIISSPTAIATLTPVVSSSSESTNAHGNADGKYDDSSNEIKRVQKPSLLTIRNVMKLLFDNICFDVFNTIIPANHNQ